MAKQWRLLIPLCLILVLLETNTPCFGAGNETIYPLPNVEKSGFKASSQTFWQNETPAVLRRYFPTGFVESGGTHPISVSCTSNPFATEAITSTDTGFTVGGNRVRASSDGTGRAVPIDYSTVGVNCVNTGRVTARVAICALSGDNAAPNFHRAPGSNYFVNAVETNPSIPADCTGLFDAIITNGAITAVRSIASPFPIGLSRLWGLADVRECGAKMDDTTDDTTQIQRCLDQYTAVALPPGIAKTTGTITLKRGQHFIGLGTGDQNGIGGSQIHYGGTGIAVTAVELTNPGWRWQGAIKNLRIVTTTGTHGLRISQLSEFQVTGVTIKGFSVAGIHLLGVAGRPTINIFIDHNYLIENTGVGLLADGANNVVNHIVVTVNRIQGNTGSGLSLIGLFDAWTIDSNDIEGNGFPQADLNGITGGTFHGNFLEYGGTGRSVVRLANTGHVSGLTIMGNVFSGAGATTLECIHAGVSANVVGLVVQGNLFNGCVSGINPSNVRGAVLGPNSVPGGIPHVALAGATSTGIVQHDHGGLRWYAGASAALQAYKFDGVLQLGTAVTTGAGIGDAYIFNNGSLRWTDSTIATFGSKIKSRSFDTLTNGQTVSLGMEHALIAILDDNPAGPGDALFIIRGGFYATTELLDPQARYSVTKNTAASTNIYYEAYDYILQNSSGVTLSYKIFYLSGTQ